MRVPKDIAGFLGLAVDTVVELIAPVCGLNDAPALWHKELLKELAPLSVPAEDRAQPRGGREGEGPSEKPALLLFGPPNGFPPPPWARRRQVMSR